jgi:hypothetical protein
MSEPRAGDTFDMSGDFRQAHIYIKSGVEGSLALSAPQSLHQIPEPTATFKGRKKELDELTEAIREGGVAISGVRGMGGIGKTVLALKLAPLLQWR